MRNRSSEFVRLKFIGKTFFFFSFFFLFFFFFFTVVTGVVLVFLMYTVWTFARFHSSRHSQVYWKEY